MTPDAILLERYPHISFRKTWDLSKNVLYMLGKCDAMVEAIAAMPLQPEYRKMLHRVSLIKGAQATTAIEGNSLTEAEVERVAQGDSLPPSKEYQEREVRNILDAMNTLLKSVAIDGHTPLICEELILGFHKEVGKELGEHFDAIPGRFREDARVVGPYRCPRHEDVRDLIRKLCDWLPREFGFASGKQSFADAVIQAIVTHVYIEWIHPFGDGNGRTGRLLEFYILLRAGNPDLASHILSNYYNETRPEYYRQLDRASKQRDLTSFIEYAVLGYHDGLVEVLNTIQTSNLEIAWRHHVYSQFSELPYRKKTVFKRRRRLALSMPIGKELALPELLVLTTELAREYATLSIRTMLRDLDELKRLELIIENPAGKFTVNIEVLGSQMARRRVGRVTAA